MKIIRSRFFFHEAKPGITPEEKGRSVLPLLLDDRHVNELVVPLSRVDFLAFIVDGRSHNHLHNLRIVVDGLW
jgi:hypothetical protein